MESGCVYTDCSLYGGGSHFWTVGEGEQPAERLEYIAGEKMGAESSLEDIGEHSEGRVTEGSLKSGSAQDIFEEDPQIIHSDLTEELNFVFLSEEIFCMHTGDAWIYMNQQGKALTSDSYTRAYPFHEGLACVYKDGKYGFIDTEGNTAIDFLYDRAMPLTEGLAYFCRDGRYGFMDRTGKPQFYLDCDSVSTFHEGLAFISVDGKYGYIDRTGKVVIEPIYDCGDYFQEGYAKIWRNNKQGIIDGTGREILAPVYVEIKREGDYFIGEKDGKYSVFDREGNPLLETPGDDVSVDQDIINIFYEDTGKTGHIYQGKAVLLDLPYDIKTVIPDRELVIAWQGENCGVVNFQGEVKVPFCHYNITYDEDGGVFIVSDVTEEGRKPGIIDAEDFSLRAMGVYDDIYPFVEDCAIVRIGQKYGAIDTEGNLVMPVAYDQIGSLKNGGYWYNKGGTSYLYDAEGQVLNWGNYDFISPVGDCYVTSRNHYDVGLLNAAGEELLPPVYYRSSYRCYDGYRNGVMVLYPKDSGGGCMIVRTQEGEDGALSELFMRNEITPRISPFWEFVQNGSFAVKDMAAEFPWSETAVSEWNCAENVYSIYDFGHTGNPVLYVCSVPYVQEGPRKMSYSGFFARQGEDVVCLFSGYECGGTAGGNYMSLWYDNEKEELLLGEQGYTEGFEVSRHIYDYRGGEILERVSLGWITQGAGNYTEEELLENAELYYDERDQPYTRETISNVGYITEYSVNGELVTQEQYQEIKERYREMPLPH